MSDAASIIPRAVSLPRVSAASSRRVSAGSSDFARGRHRPLSRRVLPPRSVAVRRDAMASLGTMKPEIVADGVLHVRTPLIISKPMRCASPHHRPTPPLPSTTDRSDPLTASPTPDIAANASARTCTSSSTPSSPPAVQTPRHRLHLPEGGGRGRSVSHPLPAETRLGHGVRRSRWGAPTTVVVPETTPSSFAIDSDPTAPHEVHGSVVRGERTRRRAVRRRTATRPPLRGRLHVDRMATVVHEMRDDLAALGLGDVIPGAVVTCVGGGGLLAGILQGLDEVGWGRDVPVVAAETGSGGIPGDAAGRGTRRDPSRDRVRGQIPGRGVPSRPFDMRRETRGSVGAFVAGGGRRAAEACKRFADEHRPLRNRGGAALAAVYSPSANTLRMSRGRSSWRCAAGPSSTGRPWRGTRDSSGSTSETDVGIFHRIRLGTATCAKSTTCRARAQGCTPISG